VVHHSGSLDANVLLRLLLNDIPKQHDAAKKLFGASTSQLAVADTAIIEVVFALERYYKFKRTHISEAIGGLMSLNTINCNGGLFAKALPLFVRHPGLSFEDCCLAAYAELDDAMPLWTFDKKLANQASSAKLVPSGR
jgi:predicted nucleic-acid-binding protein